MSNEFPNLSYPTLQPIPLAMPRRSPRLSSNRNTNATNQNVGTNQISSNNSNSDSQPMQFIPPDASYEPHPPPLMVDHSTSNDEAQNDQNHQNSNSKKSQNGPNDGDLSTKIEGSDSDQMVEMDRIESKSSQIPFGLYSESGSIPGFNTISGQITNPISNGISNLNNGNPFLAPGQYDGNNLNNLNNVQFALLPPQQSQMVNMNPVFGPGGYLPPYDAMRSGFGEGDRMVDVPYANTHHGGHGVHGSTHPELHSVQPADDVMSSLINGFKEELDPKIQSEEEPQGRPRKGKRKRKNKDSSKKRKKKKTEHSYSSMCEMVGGAVGEGINPEVAVKGGAGNGYRMVLDEPVNKSMLSCHQCKNKKTLERIIVCGHVYKINTTVKTCTKKYCKSCLLRFYLEAPPTDNKEPSWSSWKCPCCRYICCCAWCRKKKAKRLESVSGCIRAEAHRLTPAISLARKLVSESRVSHTKEENLPPVLST